MHLPDGLIPLWQAAIYWILTMIILALYLYKLSKTEDKQKVLINTAILAAVTFAASSISIPSPFGVPIHLFIIPLVVILLGPLSGVAVAFLCFIAQFLFLGMGGYNLFRSQCGNHGDCDEFFHLLLLQIHSRT